MQAVHGWIWILSNSRTICPYLPDNLNVFTLVGLVFCNESLRTRFVAVLTSFVVLSRSSQQGRFNVHIQICGSVTVALLRSYY